MTCKNKDWVFHPEVKGCRHECPRPLMVLLIYSMFQTLPSLHKQVGKARTNGSGPAAAIHTGKPFVPGNDHLWKTQQCQIHKHRNILSCSPNRLSNQRNSENNGCANNSSSVHVSALIFNGVSNQVLVYGSAPLAWPWIRIDITERWDKEL